MKRFKGVKSIMNVCKYVIGLYSCSIILLAINCHAERFGLFLSNGTCILKFSGKENFTVIFCQTNGNLVGLDVDGEAALIFWSNNDRTNNQNGIFSANLNGTNVTKIFTDTRTINGLTVDRFARFLYWTDEEFQYLQSSKYDGSCMRIVVFQDLRMPRGLVVDHMQGWLFWNDQEKHTVEMSMLDGSERKVLASNITQANQMAIDMLNETARKLYFVDAANHSLKSILLLSSNTSPEPLVRSAEVELTFDRSLISENETIFGLAAEGELLYVGTWIDCRLIEVNLTNKVSLVVSDKLGTNRLFSLAILKDDVSLVPVNGPSVNTAPKSVFDNSSSSNFTTISPFHNWTTDNSNYYNNVDGNSTANNGTDSNNTTNGNSMADGNSTNHNSILDNSTSHDSPIDDSTANDTMANNSTSEFNSTNQNTAADNNSTNQNTAADNNSTNHNTTAGNSTNNPAPGVDLSGRNASNAGTCNWRQSTCSHICIPLGPKLGHRCACPTYGGLSVEDTGRNCTTPSEVLVYADVNYKHVGWLDVSKKRSNQSPDLHLIARSPRPIAIAYDPLEKLVYWSDPKDGCIHKRPFNASKSSNIFLSDNINIVDGLAIDYARRNLYFSNMDESTVNGTLYTKHNIEIVRLGDRNARVVLTRNVKKPRGLWIDFDAKHLYYTDWGQPSKVVRSNLEGTNATIILTNQNNFFQNPNSVVTTLNKVFVASSSENLKTKESALPIDSLGRGRLWYIDKDRLNNNLVPYNWSDLDLQNQKSPFGMTTSSSSSSSSIFISSWIDGCLLEFNITTEESFCFANSSGLAGLAFVDSNVAVAKDDACQLPFNCSSKTNGGMCLLSGGSTSRCRCPSYGGRVMSSDTNNCTVPENFFLIADMMSIKMLGYKTTDESLYEVVTGNFSTSYSALAYDPKSGVIFYSDVNQKTIRRTTLKESPNNEPFYGGPLIDDMLFYEGSLYWINNEYNASIARLTLASDSTGNPPRHEVLLSNLTQRPKSLAIHETKGHLYFTSDELPYVWRFKSKDGKGQVDRFVADGHLFESGPLFIDQEEEVLYLMDKQNGSVISCRLDRLNQTGAFKSVANLTGGLYFYSFVVHNNSIYYSNWADRSIRVFDVLNKTTRTVAGDLTRPTRFLLQNSAPKVAPKSFPPYFIGCPQSIRVFTTSAAETVWWKAPVLAGTSEKKEEESISVSNAPGSSFSPGFHVVSYSASDRGLIAECSFNVSVSKIEGSLSCDKKYSVVHGDLSCTVNTSTPSCTVECHKNYVPLFQGKSTFEFCGAGSNRTNVFFCAETLRRATMVRLRIGFSGSCPKDGNVFALKLSYAFYLMGLCSPADSIYQSSDLCNQQNFRGIECSGAVREKRDGQFPELKFIQELLLNETDSLLKKIEKLNSSLNKLNVQYNNETFQATTITANETTNACPSYSFEVSNGNCEICPYGTMFNSESSTCTMCLENTYQYLDGQSMCFRCPAGQVSPPGSFSNRQCLIEEAHQYKEGGSTTSLIVGVIVSLILGIIVVIALVLLACWHAKKKEQSLFESETRRRMDAKRYGDYQDEGDDPIPLATHRTSEGHARRGRSNSGFEATASV